MMRKIPDKLYTQILENMPICCVDLVLHNNGRVLLVYRKEEPAKNKWWVPGGRIQKNEKLADAAVRKAFEETGLKVRVEKQIGIYELMFKEAIFKGVKTGTHAIAAVYLVSPVDSSQKARIDSTSDDYKWIDKIEKDLDPYVGKILRESGVFD